MIVHDVGQRMVHLRNDQISYIFHILPTGNLEHLHFGAALPESLEVMSLTNRSRQNWTTHRSVEGIAFSDERLRQEYPCSRGNDFRVPAADFEIDGQAIVSAWRLEEVQTEPESPDWGVLPHPRGRAETVIVRLCDEAHGIDLDLIYQMFCDSPVVARSARVSYRGGGELRILKLLSSSIDIPSASLRTLTLQGGGQYEMVPVRQRVCQGEIRVASRKGASGSEHNPFLAIGPETTTETTGWVIGQNLLYSGNFETVVQTDAYQMSRVMTGINHEGFSWTLRRGEHFQAPVALLAHAAEGYTELSAAFGEYYRLHVIDPNMRDAGRPILVNTWESFYMKISEQKVIDFADEAIAVGAGLVVIDDGWFKRRTWDDAGLGDWEVDRSKFPHGLGAVADAIHGRGAKMGIWIEPEMVNPESDLHRAHPKWVAADLAAPHSIARTQLVLDMTNPEVLDYLTRRISAALSESRADYVKWDMNRDITEPHSAYLARIGRQSEFFHRYILGVYTLYTRLHQRFPHVMFESCASGGNRFDAGMLFYAPQAWLSDNTDAYSRQRIQYGASFAYPLFAIGAHVSASPNEQIGRSSPLASRIATAMFGTFGYELDLSRLSCEEKEAIRAANAFFRAHDAVLRTGRFYRLGDPFHDDRFAWLVVSQNRDVAVVAAFKPLNQVRPAYTRLLVPGLDEKAMYRVSLFDRGQEISGAVLAHVGIDLQPLTDEPMYQCDFAGALGELKRI